MTCIHGPCIHYESFVTYFLSYPFPSPDVLLQGSTTQRYAPVTTSCDAGPPIPLIPNTPPLHRNSYDRTLSLSLSLGDTNSVTVTRPSTTVLIKGETLVGPSHSHRTRRSEGWVEDAGDVGTEGALRLRRTRVESQTRVKCEEVGVGQRDKFLLVLKSTTTRSRHPGVLLGRWRESSQRRGSCVRKTHKTRSVSDHSPL